MSKGLQGLKLVMLLGLTGLLGCTPGDAPRSSTIQVTCADGSTCEGTSAECSAACAPVESQTSAAIKPALGQVTVWCCDGSKCSGTKDDCAGFCDGVSCAD